MTNAKNPPDHAKSRPSEAARRAERLAAALRENLKKRKIQERLRDAPPPGDKDA